MRLGVKVRVRVGVRYPAVCSGASSMTPRIDEEVHHTVDHSIIRYVARFSVQRSPRENVVIAMLNIGTVSTSIWRCEGMAIEYRATPLTPRHGASLSFLKHSFPPDKFARYVSLKSCHVLCRVSCFVFRIQWNCKKCHY